MKKLGLTLALGLVFLQVFGGNFPTEIKQKQVAADTLIKEGMDPVCKMKVKAGTTKTIVLEKIIYGFCSESCKKLFKAQPKKYIK